ncbi:MAG TPA: TolC family protein [Polyangia bacterium]|jgi:outer membrane protein TolC|nr:TolC family protein [Polyangia bacterium]
MSTTETPAGLVLRPWVVALPTLFILALPATAAAKKLTLPELLDMARAANAGLLATAAATNAMEAQVSEARRNWLPSGDVFSILAPSPNIHCTDAAHGGGGVENCTSTNYAEPTPQNTLGNLSGVFTRTEVKLIQPIWDFGKISAGVDAARAGVGVARAREAGARADLELNVRKAYYGYKLARDLLATLEEGSGYIDDGQKRVDKDLAAGTGTVTVTDKLRLRTIRAEVDARLLEAKRLGNLARDSLRVLTGATGELEVDEEPLEPIDVKERPIAYYEDQARFNRPEVQMLDHAVKAKWALADLERRKEYPDLVLVGTAALAHASSVDNPQNAFLSHYYNTATAGIAAALRVQLDIGPKLARADRTRAEAREIEFRRTEALGGIALEVRRAYGELTEAVDRTEALRKGEKAGKAWISAVAQNFALGLAEARDLSDALLAFFQMRARYLQSVFDLNVASAALARATGASAL